MYRKTYVKVNIDNLKNNVLKIRNRYNNYKYYIAMVKANAYGHGYYIVNDLINAGINYFAVSSLDEAMKIRGYNKKIPIIITEIVDSDCIDIALKNNITLTIDNINYLKKIKDNVIIHLKIDTGLNRIGIKTKEELKSIVEYIDKHKNITLEGIYTHFGTPGITDIYYDKQVESFKSITSLIDLNKIPIVHLKSSFSLVAKPQLPFETGVRIGTLLFGYDLTLPPYSNNLKDRLRKLRDMYYSYKCHISPVIRGSKLELKPAFSVISNVMEIREVKKGCRLGYGTNTLKEDMLIAVIPIGYDDGIGTNTVERYVLINKRKYKVVSSICMCMSFAKVDEMVKVNDEVVILGDNLTVGYMSRLNNTSIQNTLINIGKSLPKVYEKNGKTVKIVV